MKKFLITLLATGMLSSCSMFTDSFVKDFNSYKHAVVVDGDYPTDHHLFELSTKYDAIIIKRGVGGNFGGMKEFVSYLKTTDIKIIIDGPCMSACVLLMNAKDNVRFTENAFFYIHSVVTVVKNKDGTETRTLSPEGNKSYLTYFPEDFAKYIDHFEMMKTTTFSIVSSVTTRQWFSNMFTKRSNFKYYIKD